MPDIAMCEGTNCPLKDNCYRHTATPYTHWQNYIEPPYKDGKCGYFISNEKMKKWEENTWDKLQRKLKNDS